MYLSKYTHPSDGLSDNIFHIYGLNAEKRNLYINFNYIYAQECTAFIDTGANKSWITNNSKLNYSKNKFIYLPSLLISINSTKLQFIKYFLKITIQLSDIDEYKFDKISVGRDIKKQSRYRYRTWFRHFATIRPNCFRQ